MGRIAISFDDGLLDQFKWARGLYQYGISGTFYICPFFVDHPWYLTLDQLKRMKNDWGHVIANHFWIHECPADKANMDIILGNLALAGQWLDEHGFEDGSKLLALPYGSVGGKWTDEHIKELFEYCDQIRDVGSGLNDFGKKFLSATDSTNFIDVKDKLMCHYFHSNHSASGAFDTSDEDFISFLDSIKASDVEISSMLKEAQNATEYAV